MIANLIFNIVSIKNIKVLLALVVYNLSRMIHQLMSLDRDVTRENEYFLIPGF